MRRLLVLLLAMILAPDVPARPRRSLRMAAQPKQELVDKVGKLVADRFGQNYNLAFAYYANRDDRITRDGLLTMLVDAGIGNRMTRGAWAAGIIAALDTDKDGAISVAEFAAALLRR